MDQMDPLFNFIIFEIQNKKIIHCYIQKKKKKKRKKNGERNDEVEKQKICCKEK